MVRIISYDDQQLFLEIFSHKKLLKKDANKIFIVSDLKFLIQNVLQLLLKHENFTLPQKSPKLKIQAPSYLNIEQKQALEAIFSHPLCYVWGPPGSGKTKAVLFEALLIYLALGKQVVILAPTNSALEQILFGLLPLLQSSNFSLLKILRLGLASIEYTGLYKETLYEDDTKKKSFSTSAFELFEQEDKKISLKSRIKQSLLIASTIDTFIMTTIRGDIKNTYSHLFIDEAGFAPLMKVSAIVCEDIPVTLLGDHKQLSPISEIPKQEQSLMSDDLFMWDIASVYLGYLSDGDTFSSLTHDYQNNALNFKGTVQKCELLKTHRYGQNLAEILDRHIYQNGLTSHKDEQSNLFFAHTPQRSFKPLENEAEVEACKMIVLELLHIGIDDIGIITPFNNQKRALERAIAPLRYQDRILTFHKAQGKEFHTLLISPVYKHRYLTDSYQQSAKEALNVAISRAKQNIIFVCDYNYWMKDSRQFITDILKSSSPFDLNFFV